MVLGPWEITVYLIIYMYLVHPGLLEDRSGLWDRELRSLQLIRLRPQHLSLQPDRSRPVSLWDRSDRSRLSVQMAPALPSDRTGQVDRLRL